MEYADKTGEFPFQNKTSERPFMVLVGHSTSSEDRFSQVEALKRGAHYANSGYLEKELSEALGREIKLPRDPQLVATYAPNVYVYFVAKGLACVAVHLYYPSGESVMYSHGKVAIFIAMQHVMAPKRLKIKIVA